MKEKHLITTTAYDKNAFIFHSIKSTTLNGFRRKDKWQRHEIKFKLIKPTNK